MPRGGNARSAQARRGGGGAISGAAPPVAHSPPAVIALAEAGAVTATAGAAIITGQAAQCAGATCTARSVQGAGAAMGAATTTAVLSQPGDAAGNSTAISPNSTATTAIRAGTCQRRGGNIRGRVTFMAVLLRLGGPAASAVMPQPAGALPHPPARSRGAA